LLFATLDKASSWAQAGAGSRQHTEKNGNELLWNAKLGYVTADIYFSLSLSLTLGSFLYIIFVAVQSIHVMPFFKSCSNIFMEKQI